jgi:hypothetical protein
VAVSRNVPRCVARYGLRVTTSSKFSNLAVDGDLQVEEETV